MLQSEERDRASLSAPDRRRLIYAIVAVGLWSGPARAQSDDAIAFDLPAQPLEAALAQYFRRTDVQLLYDSELTAGRQSRAVRGLYSPREALGLMLGGTGISVRYSRTNSAILAARNSSEGAPVVPLGTVTVRERAPESAPSSFQRLIYYTSVEAALQARLGEDERTQRLSFRLTASVAIEGDGRVSDASVARSSGNRAVDRRVIAVVGSTVLPPPPAGLGQPLLVVLIGRP